VAVNVEGHSLPDVNEADLLYCKVAKALYVGDLSRVADVLLPSIESIPFTAKTFVKVFAPVPETVTLLKVVVEEPAMVCAAPLKMTVPEISVKAPLLVQSALTVKVFAPEMVSDDEGLMVILLQTAVAPIIGLLVTFGMMTSSVLIGFDPADQFVAILQSVFVTPVQELITGIVSIPVREVVNAELV
jgi:hypothetical protein